MDVNQISIFVKKRFLEARVARLATINADMAFNIVPICFAVDDLEDKLVFSPINGNPKMLLSKS